MFQDPPRKDLRCSSTVFVLEDTGDELVSELRVPLSFLGGLLSDFLGMGLGTPGALFA